MASMLLLFLDTFIKSMELNKDMINTKIKKIENDIKKLCLVQMMRKFDECCVMYSSQHNQYK